MPLSTRYCLSVLCPKLCRFVMLLCSSILSLSFFAEFRWVEWEAKRTKFQPLSKVYLWMGWISIACYAVTMGSIDGEGIGKLHVPCAIVFFLVFLVTIVRLTFYYNSLRNWDSSCISKNSLLVKKILALYIVAIWAYSLFMLLTTNHDQIIYVVIAEWNSFFANLLWFLSSVF